MERFREAVLDKFIEVQLIGSPEDKIEAFELWKVVTEMNKEELIGLYKHLKKAGIIVKGGGNKK